MTLMMKANFSGNYRFKSTFYSLLYCVYFSATHCSEYTSAPPVNSHKPVW